MMYVYVHVPTWVRACQDFFEYSPQYVEKVLPIVR
jgi:hypothetical protein